MCLRWLYFSAIALRLAKPSSNLAPTILPMLKTKLINLDTKELEPYIAWHTVVVSLIEINVNSTVLCASNGL